MEVYKKSVCGVALPFINHTCIYILFCSNICQDELKQLAKSERMAVHISNIANLFLFMAKVYASVESRSLAVIASTMDSFLDLLSGLILWFTSHAMKNPNQYHYPIGKKRMQPVVRSSHCISLLKISRFVALHYKNDFVIQMGVQLYKRLPRDKLPLCITVQQASILFILFLLIKSYCYIMSFWQNRN